MSICSKDIERKLNSDYDFVTNLSKMTGDNPNLDLININAYIKFGKIISICSQDVENEIMNKIQP